MPEYNNEFEKMLISMVGILFAVGIALAIGIYLSI
jgi:hypothetical protein